VQFYDDLAEYYELIFPDWEESMARQGAAISDLLRVHGPRRVSETVRVLDVSAGIGTQSLPLASSGFEVTARDASPAAIGRLKREAARRGLDVDAAPADMRELRESVTGPFDAVISFDNSLPHLLADAEITKALEGFRAILSPDGLLLLSVRDYSKVDRSVASSHPYGERTRSGKRFRLRQDWTWIDASHYHTTFVVEQHTHAGWNEVVRTVAPYYAISVPHLLTLMEDSGFEARVTDVQFYQPVLMGRISGRSAYSLLTSARLPPIDP
jgi:cyclopropane fatty-acyl-phospholipid synthase-like methyltransferase